MDQQNADLPAIDVGHRRKQEKPNAQHGGDQDGEQLMQRHQQRMIAGHQIRFHSGPPPQSTTPFQCSMGA